MSSDNRCISYKNLARYNDWRAHIGRSSYEIDQKVLLARNSFDHYTISHGKKQKNEPMGYRGLPYDERRQCVIWAKGSFNPNHPRY